MPSFSMTNATLHSMYRPVVDSESMNSKGRLVSTGSPIWSEASRRDVGVVVSTSSLLLVRCFAPFFSGSLNCSNSTSIALSFLDDWRREGVVDRRIVGGFCTNDENARDDGVVWKNEVKAPVMERWCPRNASTMALNVEEEYIIAFYITPRVVTVKLMWSVGALDDLHALSEYVMHG